MGSVKDKIMQILKDEAARDLPEYTNPHFLNLITSALDEYYQLEDDAVDEYISDMYGR